MKLLELLTQEESKTLEFKRDLSSPEGFLKSIVAFSNTSGGVILLGVEDKTKSITGICDPLRVEEKIANLVSDCVKPIVLPDVEVLPWRAMHVIAVRVYPSSLRPHFLAKAGREQGVYVRVGSTNRRAEPEMIDELERFGRGESFDERACPDLDSEEVDFRVASEQFSHRRNLRPQDLKTLRLLTAFRNREVPTIGGLLLFGRDRLRHFPDAWIQVGRFAGVDRSRILDSRDLKGALISSIDEASHFIEKHTVREFVIAGLRRIERWNIPPAAIREALVNAVVHADFSQKGAPIRVALFEHRLEIESPGLLPFGLTVDDIQRGISKLRNRVLGRVFHELGLIEQWGSGIQRMIAGCLESGSPPPHFEEIGTHFRVTFTFAAEEPVRRDRLDEAILAALADGAGLSTHEIAARIRLSERATRTRLVTLVGRGLVSEVGSSPRDPRRQYYLTRRPS